MARKFRKISKYCDFSDFDYFSQILVGAGRGAVQRCAHDIYFLDRSRCPKHDFEKYSMVSRTPGTIMQNYDSGPTGCVLPRCWSWPADRPGAGGGAEISEIDKAHESKGGERPNVRHFLFF